MDRQTVVFHLLMRGASASAGLVKVCICFVVHRTGRSAIHGRWFSVFVCFFFV